MAAKKSAESQWDKLRRRVDVDQTDVSVREIVRMAADQDIKRSPEYQRKFRWSPKQRSTLVESLLIGIPVPGIFVAVNDDGKWELVDGLQRVSTLMHFVGNSLEGISALTELGENQPLTLLGLTKLTMFEGMSFNKIPETVQRHFLARSLRVTAISDKSDFDVRFDTFERLNRGGVALTPQEVRACISRGNFSKQLKKLAQNEHFRALLKLQKSHDEDGTREEQVLKFFAYLETRDEFRGAVTEFLNSYMKNHADVGLSSEQIDLFNSSSECIYKIFQGPFLRRGYGVTPLNQFEAVLIAAGEVIRSGRKIKLSDSEVLAGDESLIASSTKGTNTSASLHRRIERAGALLRGRP